ncbi:MAG: hypothetical protein KUG65_07900 [Sphingomonadaceae bacterium]|nr:hypothetical protein [Sphingomonadaceae bacterium]
MRVVIYDEESLEPITVVNLPGLTERNLEEKQYWRVSVHDGRNTPADMPAERAYSDRLRFVDLTFERVTRVTLTYGEQITWRCLTRAADLAILLTPDWLPGQRPALDLLEQENERLADLMTRSLSSR